MEKCKVAHQYIEARLAAENADRETRTVPMTFYSGSPVLQFSWEHGMHNLTLSMEPGHVRMKRMKAGAPFTKGHRDPNNPDAVIGRVQAARLENGAAVADVRFSKRPEVDAIFADVLDGILENVSVEARLYKLKETTKDGDKMKSFLATDWEPTAVALVAQGADPNAKIKASEEVQFSECQIETRASSPQEQTMDPIETTGKEAPVINAAALQEEARLSENKRVTEILEIAKLGKLEDGLAQTHIASGTTADGFRKIAFDALAKRSEENPTQQHRASVERDQIETRRLAIPRAIMAVQGMAKLDSNEPAVEFRSLASRGLLALAADCLYVAGKDPRHMSNDEIARLALTTSDLPYLLGATADTALRSGYDAVPSQWPRISARRTVNNFRPQYDLKATLVASFPQVTDSGEYKTATLTEGRETYRVYTYGQKLHITRQTIINDSLGGLTDIPRQMGARAAYRQASLFWAHLIANGTLSDTNALFSTAHSNLITSPGTVINVDNLGIARKALALQTNEAGETIGLTPSFMVVSAAKEQLARQYLSNAYNPTANSSINPWAGMAELIVEPRLDGGGSPNAWYLFADPNLAPVLVAVYLAGNEGVFAQAETTVDIDGFAWLMRFDFGVGSVDHRGAVRNDGA